MDKQLYFETLVRYMSNFYNANLDESKTSDIALSDVLILSGYKDKKVYAFNTLDYMFGTSPNQESIDKLLSQNKTKLNNLYNLYKRPLTTNEINKITFTLLDSISNYDNRDSVAKADTQALLLMLHDMMKNDKNCRKVLRQVIQESISCYPYAKSVLNKDIPEEFKKSRFEQAITPLLLDLLEANIYLQIINKETVSKYMDLMSPQLRDKFLMMEQRLDYKQQDYYYTPTNLINSKYDVDIKLIQK